VSGVRVQVPGSSANLGPGFDVLAVALGLHLTVEVEETGRFWFATDLHLRRDRNNLIVRAFERLLPADRYEFRVSSTIPLSGGMGSSAAGVIAGLLAAERLAAGGTAGEPAREQGGAADPERLLALATEIEGHPDNVAASLLGGIVICDGPQARRFDPPAGLEAVLVVPGTPVRTALAREALPAQVPLADAVANVAAASKLVLGLARDDAELVAAGLRDRLHQPYRAHLYPRSAELVEHAPEIGALGATISGAGPTVLVWVRTDDAERVTATLTRDAGGWAQVLRVPFEPLGATVSPL
jgi:homoserine kinase